MKVLFERKFLKEISLADKHTKHLVERAILNSEKAKTLMDVENLKKLKGSKDAYRIRVGNYRVAFISITTRLFLPVSFTGRRFTGISPKMGKFWYFYPLYASFTYS